VSGARLQTLSFYLSFKDTDDPDSVIKALTDIGDKVFDTNEEIINT